MGRIVNPLQRFLRLFVETGARWKSSPGLPLIACLFVYLLLFYAVKKPFQRAVSVSVASSLVIRTDICLQVPQRPSLCGLGLERMEAFPEDNVIWFLIVFVHFLAFVLLYAQSFMAGGGSWLRGLNAALLAFFQLSLALEEVPRLDGVKCRFWNLPYPFESWGWKVLFAVTEYVWEGYLFLAFAALAGGTGLALALKKRGSGASSGQKGSSSLASAQSLLGRVFLAFWLVVPALVLACVAWGAGKPVVHGFAIPQVDASRCPVLWAEEPCLAGLIELALLVFLGAWLGVWVWVGGPSVGALGVFLLACWGMMVGLFGFFGWPWLDLGLFGFFLGEYPWPLAKNQPLWLALAGLCWLGASWVLARSPRRAESR
jgi:hypothetical protein